MGHLGNSKQCPNYKKKAAEQEGIGNTIWEQYEASMYTMVRWEDEAEYTVNNKVKQALEPTEVFLNNQANISIMHPMLLKNIEKAEIRLRVKEVGGLQLVVNQVGIMTYRSKL
jgi:hypothetical protein